MVKIIENAKYTAYKPEEGDVYIPQYDRASEAQRKGPRGAFTAYSVQVEVVKDASGKINGETIYLTLSGKAQADMISGNKDKEVGVYSYNTKHRDGCLGFTNDLSRCGATSTPSLSISKVEKPTVGLEFLDQVKSWLQQNITKERISETLQQQGKLSVDDANKLISYAEQ